MSVEDIGQILIKPVDNAYVEAASPAAQNFRNNPLGDLGLTIAETGVNQEVEQNIPSAVYLVTQDGYTGTDFGTIEFTNPNFAAAITEGIAQLRQELEEEGVFPVSFDARYQVKEKDSETSEILDATPTPTAEGDINVVFTHLDGFTLGTLNAGEWDFETFKNEEVMQKLNLTQWGHVVPSGAEIALWDFETNEFIVRINLSEVFSGVEVAEVPEAVSALETSLYIPELLNTPYFSSFTPEQIEARFAGLPGKMDHLGGYTVSLDANGYPTHVFDEYSNAWVEVSEDEIRVAVSAQVESFIDNYDKEKSFNVVASAEITDTNLVPGGSQVWIVQTNELEEYGVKPFIFSENPIGRVVEVGGIPIDLNGPQAVYLASQQARTRFGCGPDENGNDNWFTRNYGVPSTSSECRRVKGWYDPAQPTVYILRGVAPRGAFGAGAVVYNDGHVTVRPISNNGINIVEIYTSSGQANAIPKYRSRLKGLETVTVADILEQGVFVTGLSENNEGNLRTRLSVPTYIESYTVENYRSDMLVSEDMDYENSFFWAHDSLERRGPGNPPPRDQQAMWFNG
jgi:hypothetical protein